MQEKSKRLVIHGNELLPSWNEEFEPFELAMGNRYKDYCHPIWVFWDFYKAIGATFTEFMKCEYGSEREVTPELQYYVEVLLAASSNEVFDSAKIAHAECRVIEHFAGGNWQCTQSNNHCTQPWQLFYYDASCWSYEEIEEVIEQYFEGVKNNAK